MSLARIPLLLVGILGFAVSTWSARPAIGTDVYGWAFASAWASTAWLALCWGLLRWRLAIALTALLGVLATEALFLSPTDPLVYVVKPLWQVLAIAAGAAIAILARKLREFDV